MKTGALSQTVTSGNDNNQTALIGSTQNATIPGLVDTKVTVGGNVTQTISGSNNNQELLLGSAKDSSAANFKSEVTVKGGVTQSATGDGHNQRATFGSMR